MAIYSKGQTFYIIESNLNAILFLSDKYEAQSLITSSVTVSYNNYRLKSLDKIENLIRRNFLKNRQFSAVLADKNRGHKNRKQAVLIDWVN
jgi:hypothetical protein